MYTNAPTPELYRVAELRRREDLITAREMRQGRLLTRPVRVASRIRHRLGSMLIAVGIWLTPALDGSSSARELAAG